MTLMGQLRASTIYHRRRSFLGGVLKADDKAKRLLRDHHKTLKPKKLKGKLFGKRFKKAISKDKLTKNDPFLTAILPQAQKQPFPTAQHKQPQRGAGATTTKRGSFTGKPAAVATAQPANQSRGASGYRGKKIIICKSNNSGLTPPTKCSPGGGGHKIQPPKMGVPNV